MNSKRAGVIILLAFCCGVQAQDQQGDALSDALIPIEVLDPDPAFTGQVFQKGIRWNAPVLAAQPARIARGIVLRETKGTIPHGTVLALALLGEIAADADDKPIFEVPNDRQAWCEDPPGGPVTVRCFQDLDGDSKLDAQMTGYLPRTDALTLNRVGPSKPMTPVLYRRATPDELTKLRLEYISCVNEDENLKFGLGIRRVDRPRLFVGAEQDACTQLAEPTDMANGERVYSIGRIKIAVATDSDERTTRVVEAIPAGTILGHVRPDHPLTDAVEVKGHTQQQAAKSTSLPFLYFVSSPSLPASPIRAGERVLTAEVAHGLTGRLKTDVIKPGWLPSSKAAYFPASTPMFGVEMSKASAQKTLEPNVVWCVPIQEHYSTAECMVKSGSGHLLTRAYQQFDVRDLSVAMNGNFVTSPVVELGPIDFGAPLELHIRFDGWKKREALVSYSFDLQGAPDRAFRKMKLRRDGNGAAWLLIGAEPLAITPSPNDPEAATVSMAQSPQAHDEAEVIDAYEFMKQMRKRR